jgi:hypothetical protein
MRRSGSIRRRAATMQSEERAMRRSGSIRRRAATMQPSTP